MHPLKVLSLTNHAGCMNQVSFVDALSVIFYDGDLDKPDSNPLFSVFLINFKSQSFAEHQSVVVTSGLHKSSVMRSVARAPAFIQLESEDILTRVERVAWFGKTMLITYEGQSCTRQPLSSIAGCMGCLSWRINLHRTLLQLQSREQRRHNSPYQGYETR